MRFSKILVLVGMGALATAAAAAGCSGGDGQSTTAASTTNTQGCAQTNPLCTAVESDCVALVDNRGKPTFGLRMAQLTVTRPEILAGPTIGKLVSEAVRMKLEECRLNGTGTFSWLIEFDTAAGTVRTGGAQPQPDPLAGYCFVDTMVDTFHIQPIVINTALDGGAFSIDIGDILVPIYLGEDPSGTPIILPLNNARLTEGTVSSDNNCIGSYNAEGLNPDNLCLPDDTNLAYVNGGTLEAFITLEEADLVIVPDLAQSLCVILSGNPSEFGDMGDPSRCKRDASGNIVLQGDWCSTTDSAATDSCKDAYALGAQFAASAVEITGICP